MNTFTRRRLLLGGLGLAGTGALAACTGTSTGPTTAASPGTFGTPPPVSPTPGQRVVAKTLTAKPVTLDLGGPTVQTWAYDDSAPGPLIRATAGDLIRVRVDNQLPADTTIHWHGIALPNRADGVPGLTQDPIRPSTAYTYEFTAPDPGTYFYHPHVGVQLDRGLYAPLIIDDPREPGRYDAEWVIVLDDWVDGTGRTPDDVLKTLTSSPGSTADGTGGMPGMDHGSMGAATGSSTATGGMGGMAMGAEPFGDAGDVAYPHYLINGRIPTAANTFTHLRVEVAHIEHPVARSHLLLEPREILEGALGRDLKQVLALLGEQLVQRVLASCDHPEPPPLAVREVADQPEQAEPRGVDARRGSLPGREPANLPAQCLAVEVEPAAQDLGLRADPRRGDGRAGLRQRRPHGANPTQADRPLSLRFVDGFRGAVRPRRRRPWHRGRPRRPARGWSRPRRSPHP